MPETLQPIDKLFASSCADHPDRTDLTCYRLRTADGEAVKQTPENLGRICRVFNAHAELVAVVRLALDLFQFATFDNGVHSPSGQSEAEHWAGQCRERMEAILATTTEEKR